jgi:YqjK-like protein
MSHRMAELAQRRATLLLRMAVQRREIAHEVGAVEARLQSVDHFLALSRGVLGNPAVIAGGLLVLVLLGRTRVLRMAGQAFLFIRGVRGLARSARRLL